MIRFLAILCHFLAREPNLHSLINAFDFLGVSFVSIFLHEITLSAIDIDNIGFLEPFLPL